MLRGRFGAAITAAVMLVCLPGVTAARGAAARRAAARRAAPRDNPIATARHASVHAEFRFRETYAEVVVLRAERLPAGASVHVATSGRDAPRVRRTLVARRAGSMNLTALFGMRHLYVGDRISVTIRSAGATRQFLYTIHARRVAVAARD